MKKLASSIVEITEDEALTLLQNYPDGPWDEKQLGRFLVENQNSCFAYTAIDNQTGHCWVEDCPTREDAIRYLNGDDPKLDRKEETR